MHLLTRETQTAYKTGRPASDILVIIQNRKHNAGAEQLLLIGRSEVFDSVGRHNPWGPYMQNGAHLHVYNNYDTSILGPNSVRNTKD